ncbi:CmcI family methyltransferase [Brevibacillus borstelensis]|uniref:CmcI family methyltransferase n=1 Tax=Brevibacillus borstelensis TaxID=45462 RepID=UPI0030C0D348
MSNQLVFLQEYIQRYRGKVKNEQNGIATFFDNLILSEGNAFLENKMQDELSTKILERAIDTLSLSGQNRYVEVVSRITRLPFSDLDGYNRLCSQGVSNCFHWKGYPLFKSTYDLAIYQMMLSEIKPATIIEIGSTYASLCWLKDMSDLFNLQACIVGIDQNYPGSIPKNIEFRQGNVSEIHRLLPQERLLSLPKPLLIIEDAHFEVLTVLRYLGNVLTPNDYLVVEDSLRKQDVVLEWAKEMNNQFVVDTYYTDFFGINTTTAVNTILTRLKE